MASSSSSSASLPSGLPTAEVSPALPGPRYLCPQVRPCSRPFLLPRLVFGIGPWMLTEMTMPGAGLWGSQQLRVCVYDLLLSLSVVCMWVSLSFSLLPRELVDGRIYRRSLGIAYCGMGSTTRPRESIKQRCQVAERLPAISRTRWDSGSVFVAEKRFWASAETTPVSLCLRTLANFISAPPTYKEDDLFCHIYKSLR